MVDDETCLVDEDVDEEDVASILESPPRDRPACLPLSSCVSDVVVSAVDLLVCC